MNKLILFCFVLFSLNAMASPSVPDNVTDANAPSDKACNCGVTADSNVPAGVGSEQTFRQEAKVREVLQHDASVEDKSKSVN